VSLRRNAKQQTIESFRPALADVAPIVVTGRYTYAQGEEINATVFVSNWSAEKITATPAVGIGDAKVPFASQTIPAGSVAAFGEAGLVATAGDLVVKTEQATVRYPIHVGEAEAVPDVTIVVGTLPTDRDGPTVLLEPTVLPESWPALEVVPEQWGPTPFPFTTSGVRAFPEHTVLAHEVFACYPLTYIPGVRGPVGIVIPHPIAKWGALVCVRDDIVVCTLSIADSFAAGEPFARTLVAALAGLAQARR
jgi:hypothetical protein